MSTNLTIYYIIAFIALSGFGVIFLNSEAILALCFFIFVGLIIQNDPVSATLDEQKQTVRSELISCMIQGSHQMAQAQKALCYKRLQLVASLNHVLNN